jgi:hypothetical protein
MYYHYVSASHKSDLVTDSDNMFLRAQYSDHGHRSNLFDNDVDLGLGLEHDLSGCHWHLQILHEAFMVAIAPGD